ncbi:Beige 1 [Alternaria alternata]|nr:Beige 1 [Alternaria alternata]
MATSRPHRSSTAASRLPPMNNQIAELRSLADELIRASEATPPTSEVLHNQSNALRRMRQLLIESNDQTHTKDAFRHVRGFETLLITLRSLSGFYKPAELPTPDRIDFFEVIKGTLDVLSDALNEHAGNRRFFAKRVEHGGWSALEQALGSTGIFGGQSQSKRDDAGQEQLFGTLFAFALGEEAMTRIFRDIDKKLDTTQSKPDEDAGPDGDSQATEIVVSSPRSMYSDTDIDLDPLRSQVRAIFSGNEILQNPDIIPTIFHFWQGLSGEDVPGTRSKALSVSVLLAILEIVSISSFNKAALHVTGVLSTVLPLLFENKCAPVEAGLLLELADGLVQYGINKLDDAYYLFRKAASSESAAKFLLRGMHSSRDPPFIQFDLSLHGFSAIELPDIGRPFPPMSTGGGYTFAAWIRVDRFDTNCHTTLFGAYDDTQTCFLMAYLERDTRCFILQTYMGHSTGVVPSVRFKKAPRFEAGRWYHIAIVHKRTKAIGMGAAKASLFVDGEFTETMKAHYPSHPPVLDSSQESFASMSSSVSKHHILAFLGTPRNLAPRLGRNVISSKLSVASFHLFSEPLSDELIAVYHKLGPRYCGNFQDRLGSFQTYRTSAELHVHNEILHPGREERSDIVAAIRANASHLMPEAKILLSFSPSSVMDDDDRNAIDESQLIRSLSRESAKTLHKYTRLHSTPIIINAAVPSVNDALSQPRGFGRLSGDPVVVVPQSLDDAIWRIGGCVAVGLKLVQSAQTLDSMLRSVNILLEAVGGNWRNCEAMEQRNGFAVLAEVIRQKIGFAMGGLVGRNPSSLDVTPEDCESFVMQLLRIVLRFVGYDENEPTESLIINPLAYRVLLVDLEIWRRATSLETQKLYYLQFAHFAKGNTRAPQTDRLNDFAVVLNSAIQFLSQLHSRSEGFRDYTNSSNYVQELLFVLYPVIVTSDNVSAETELLSRGSALTFEGQDVVIRPLSRANGHETPVVRTTNVDVSPSPSSRRVLPFRRASSFVLVSADKKKVAQQPSLNPILSPKYAAPLALKVGSSVVEATLEVVLDVFKDQIFTRKEFPGLGLFMKTPPGFQEHQAYFESYILRQTLSSVKNALQFDQQLLHEPRVLTNLARFVTHVSEAVFEGWFLDGAEPLLDFSGFLLEYLERPDIATIKSVRLCTQAIQSIRNTFLRVALLRLAESDETEGGETTTAVIEKMMYWQPIILSSVNNETFSLKMICYLLYTQLSSEHTAVRLAAANFWRSLMVQKPHETSMILADAIHGDTKDLYDGFQKLVELDNETFLEWLDKNKTEMDKFFYGSMTKSWEDFAHSQNKKTEETSQRRIAKRKEKLKQWQSDELAADNVWNHHENSTNHWRSNIHASERIKHQRVLQDQQDNATYMATVLAKLDHQLKGPCGLFEESPPARWRLDETEGRDRKRLRIIVDNTTREQSYQPKRKDTDPRERPRLDTTVPAISAKEAVGVTPVKGRSARSSSAVSGASGDPTEEPESASDDDFEMVEAMYEDEDGFEDKNRKVMRSLNRGDQVQYVCNISRVVGLEAIEGLLIVGKDCLYLLDDFFQRSDGEIVRVWQAPPDERDPYVQVIAGKEAVTTRRPPPRSQEDAVRNWKWTEVISISKRRFLHRDVGIEIFFDDGRSYLLTAVSAQARNDIHSRVLQRASHVANPEKFANSEISWRLDSLRNPEEAPQTFGSRFASAFGSASAHPATKKWLKGEMSNFHYLMFVNTLAGRTFNDLTQYPVFPWVLSNYHSEELDLSDPSNFRDLRKPIGIQDPKQEHLIRERFSSFAEMGDASHAFHYGTHYSSAMTVASYLMRLQPFSAAFFLIQGGTWDHADRMFYSIQNVWESVSAKNMADVRELTPEFYFLPDFLTNVNGYNFGLRSDGSTIDNVKLPPWAKGDPAIFIAKQREALESPYVSQNLHHWIDLIFGYKQRGEAAIEAANVFHYMTYQGAIDLDTIVDEKERAQKISVINNFGQTPPQVFQRPHPQKENITRPTKLDTAAESLHRVPGTLLESNDRISSLNYISKSDKLLCSAPFRHNIPPHHDRYMEWGFTDGSVRFYDSHSKKLIGLFEHLHSGQLTTSLFVDGSTLITAGTDCTLAIWNMNKGDRGHIDLQNATTLFGHKSSVITLAASRAFSAFLSASLDGRVFLWDLNRNEFVRELDLGPRQKRNPVPIQAARINSVTGHIVLACGSRLIVTTLNGAVLLDEDICDSEDDADSITAVAVYEGTGNEWCERELIFTGHRRGIVKIFHLTPTPPTIYTPPGSMTTTTTTTTSKWSLNLVNVLNHGDPTVPSAAAPITCILPMANHVYTGDEEGRVVAGSVALWEVNRYGSGVAILFVWRCIWLCVMFYSSVLAKNCNQWIMNGSRSQKTSSDLEQK